MKAICFASLILVAATFPAVVQAASQVPNLLSYQAHVTDASGDPIGASGPINRTVTFQFYTTSTGGAPVYAEAQVVTIAAGDFSVLLGNGTGVAGLPGPGAPAATPYVTLSSVMEGPLYLGVTVDDGTGAADAEISPRQQLASGAFAFRALVAEGLADGALDTEMIADTSITTNKIGGGQITTAKIADSNITTAKLANASITPAKLDTDTIGIWSPNGGHVYRPSGNVGIGQANPGFPLNFANAVGDKIALYGNAGNHYGLGIQGSLLQLYTSGSGADVAFGYGSSSNFSETMRIRGNGNLGIGTKTPGHKLHVVGNSLTTPESWTSGNTAFAYLGDTQNYVSATNGGATVLRGANYLSLRTGSGNTEGLRIQSNGNVGIGTGNPLQELEVRGNIAVGDASPDTKYHGSLQITRPTSAAQFINLTRSGHAVWSMGYRPNTNDFGIGGGASTDGNFNPLLNLTTDGKVSINTTNTGQGRLNVGGGIVSVGSRNGTAGYARMYYDGAGRIVFEGYNTYLNNGQWRGFSMDGNNDIDWRSDARLKENVEDAEPMLERLMQVKFHRYNWISSDDDWKEFGVIAQELEPLFPDLVGQGADGYLTVGYTSFATISAKAIQELKAEKDEEIGLLLEALAEKEARIDDLEERLLVLEKHITGGQ